MLIWLWLQEKQYSASKQAADVVEHPRQAIWYKSNTYVWMLETIYNIRASPSHLSPRSLEDQVAASLLLLLSRSCSCLFTGGKSSNIYILSYFSFYYV